MRWDGQCRHAFQVTRDAGKSHQQMPDIHQQQDGKDNGQYAICSICHGLLATFLCLEPQTDTRRLHGLIHHVEQLARQLVEFHFIPRGGAERGEGLGRVILAPIEAPIDHGLHAPPQREEQRRNDQRRDGDRQIG